MDEHRISPYVFRPILEPFEDVSAGNSGSEIRSRVYSGDLWPTSQCVSSPTTSRGAPPSSATTTIAGTTGPLALNPKLLACFKQETWSNAGSRHSSRPGMIQSKYEVTFYLTSQNCCPPLHFIATPEYENN